MRKTFGIFSLLAPVLALAQNPMPRDYDADEAGYPAGYGIMMLVFFLLLWAVVAKSGPLHEWASDHPGLAAVLVIFGPAFVGWLIT